MTATQNGLVPRRLPSQARAAYAIELCAIGICHFAFAKLCLSLTGPLQVVSPLWVPTGIALGLFLLRGYRIWPAILVAAFAANATILAPSLAVDKATAIGLATAFFIGIANTVEGLAGAWLVKRWSRGRATFTTAGGVARFAAIAALPTMLGASIGVASLLLGGFFQLANFTVLWLTWWLGDLAGALLVAPVIVLWAGSDRGALDRQKLVESILIVIAACVIGLVAFSPLFESTQHRAPLGFLAMLPLLWAALRRTPRDTATSALVLAAFAVWGTLTGAGPFERETQIESVLLLVMFMIGVTIPSLALSADVTMRRRAERALRIARDELNARVEARTAALTETNEALQAEVERRRRAEIERDQQTHDLVQAQRLANLGSWSRNLIDQKVVWSDQLYRIFGVQRGEESVDGFETFLARVHPDDRDKVRAQALNAIRTGVGFQDERRIVRPNGEIRYTQNCVEVVTDASGRSVAMHGICLDVTERKQAEIALERTREQLAQMQKMEALGQLTGGIAHDFNNLLMIVSGHTEMLRRRLDDPKQMRALDAILGAARRGESLTRQLLGFSRRQPMNPVVIDLRPRVQAMRPMLNQSLRGNIKIAVDIPDDLWPVRADIAEFEVALINIAVNARDAMPDGGSFTIAARNVPAGEGRPGHPTTDHVAVSFADTGTGIPRDALKKVFDPFFTTKPVGKGSGLGLSQVYGFASQSGGTVSVESEVGFGTTLALYLPRSIIAVAAGPEPAPSTSTEDVGGTILLVEDNPDVAEVTASLIEQIGYRVLRVGNAHEALAAIKRGDGIDLLLSDIVMPNGMNGIHLAQEVSEYFPGIRVLLVTGYSDVLAAAQTRFPVLRKPFQLPELEHAIRAVLAENGGGGARRAAGGAAR